MQSVVAPGLYASCSKASTRAPWSAAAAASDASSAGASPEAGLLDRGRELAARQSKLIGERKVMRVGRM